MGVVYLILESVALIEASLEELPVFADLGQSCLATKIRPPRPSYFGCFRHIDELRSFPSRVAKKYVDAELANTQALECVGSQQSQLDEVLGDRSDRSCQPVRPVGRRELHEDLEPHAREGPHRSSKI